MSINAYFDESGKFKDHTVTAFGGVLCSFPQYRSFAPDWEMRLNAAGIPRLTMKEALRHSVKLSDKLPALGVSKRSKALSPFIECVRRHMVVVIGVAVNVAAFQALPSHCLQVLGKDPFFLAFRLALIRIVELTPNNDVISLICDDEEAMAERMLKSRVENRRSDCSLPVDS